MWERNRIVSAINVACQRNKPAGGEYTPTQKAFMDGAKALDEYSPNYMITAVGGRELPKKYYPKYGLKVKRNKRKG
jgi:hypothetical protein